MSMSRIVAALSLAAASVFQAATAAPLTFFGQDQGIFTQSGAPTGAPRTNADAAQTAFLANLNGVGTETFESFADGTPASLALSFAGAGTATLQGGGAVEDDPGTGQGAVSGSKWWRTGAGNDFSIDFYSPVAAFGFYGIDIGDINSQLSLTFVGGTTVTVAIPHSLGGAMNGSVIYFGYIDTTNLITKVAFSNPASGDDFGFDNMTIGSVNQVVPVPEPGTLALAGLAMVALAASRRGKRQRA